MMVGDDHVLVKVEASEKEKELIEEGKNAKNPYGDGEYGIK